MQYRNNIKTPLNHVIFLTGQFSDSFSLPFQKSASTSVGMLNLIRDLCTDKICHKHVWCVSSSSHRSYIPEGKSIFCRWHRRSTAPAPCTACRQIGWPTEFRFYFEFWRIRNQFGNNNAKSQNTHKKEISVWGRHVEAAKEKEYAPYAYLTAGVLGERTTNIWHTDAQCDFGNFGAFPHF